MTSILDTYSPPAQVDDSTAVPSPCLSLCEMDPHTQICRGCHRTGVEIANWRASTPQQKVAIWHNVKQRYAEASRKLAESVNSKTV